MTADENKQAWGRYVRADCEMVQWSDADDGSAANEPVDPDSQFVTVLRSELQRGHSQLATQALFIHEQCNRIASLIGERDQFRREVVMVRELLSRLPEDSGSESATTGSGDTGHDVQGDIDRVCDHLFNDRTDDKQRAKLSTSVDRANRIRPGSDAAVGRALKP